MIWTWPGDIASGFVDGEESQQLLQNREHPIRVLIPIHYLAEQAVFRAIIELDCRLSLAPPHTAFNRYVSSLLADADRSPFDLCIGAEAASEEILRQETYARHKLVDVMFGHRHKLVVHKDFTSGTRRAPGPVSTLFDRGTGHWVLRRLVGMQLAPDTRPTNLMPDNVIASLEAFERGALSVLWSPYWQYATLFTDSFVPQPVPGEAMCTYNFLFATDSMAADNNGRTMRALCGLLRIIAARLTLHDDYLLGVSEALALDTHFVEGLAIHAGMIDIDIVWRLALGNRVSKRIA
jgi:hypothetical protein